MALAIPLGASSTLDSESSFFLVLALFRWRCYIITYARTRLNGMGPFLKRRLDVHAALGNHSAATVGNFVITVAVTAADTVSMRIRNAELKGSAVLKAHFCCVDMIWLPFGILGDLDFLPRWVRVENFPRVVRGKAVGFDLDRVHVARWGWGWHGGG